MLDSHTYYYVHLTLHARRSTLSSTLTRLSICMHINLDSTRLAQSPIYTLIYISLHTVRLLHTTTRHSASLPSRVLHRQASQMQAPRLLLHSLHLSYDVNPHQPYHRFCLYSTHFFSPTLVHPIHPSLHPIPSPSITRRNHQSNP